MTVYRMNAGTVGVEKAQGEQIKERSALGERERKREIKDRRSYLHIEASGQRGLTHTSSDALANISRDSS